MTELAVVALAAAGVIVLLRYIINNEVKEATITDREYRWWQWLKWLYETKPEARG